MSKREVKLYVKDIIDSIQKIQQYTKGLSLRQFKKKDLVIDAVVRNFEIIGEASKNIPEEIKSRYPDIPWREMAGMRDKVIHEYFGVDFDILWKTISTRLAFLKKSLNSIYQSL
jgi:uncharacterized protein with HEPN domain